MHLNVAKRFFFFITPLLAPKVKKLQRHRLSVITHQIHATLQTNPAREADGKGLRLLIFPVPL